MALRVTQGATNRSYLKNLNNSHSKMNESMEKLETGRKFSKISDDVTGATKCLDLRSKLYRNERNKDNVEGAIEEMQMSETLVTEMKDIVSNVYSDMLRASNSHTIESGKETFLSLLDQSKQEILRLANQKYNDKYLLGGLAVDDEPFKEDENGYLTIRGEKLSDIVNKNDIQGPYTDSQEKYYVNGKSVGYTHDNFIDVGLDMSSKNVTSSSRYNISVDGIMIMGYGETVTENGNSISNNIYDMMTEMEKAIENADIDRLSELTGNFKNQFDDMVSGLGEIGVRTKFLDTTLARLENENTTLLEAKNNVEATDDTTEITNFKGYQNSWNLILQFGGNIFPKSLMDYVG